LPAMDQPKVVDEFVERWTRTIGKIQHAKLFFRETRLVLRGLPIG
jgi:hypothetical protein